jgi:two-component system chemotaxis response regulator CheB
MGERERKHVAAEVVAMASSAGGLTALSDVLGGLPSSFSACILIVQHLDPGHRSVMSEILDKRSALEVREARAGDRVKPGVVYLAPPDQHLLVDADGVLTLTHTELVHFVRPSADLLFESVAAAYGERAVAVVLTGSGVDGSLGVRAIKKRGGIVIAQDRETSAFFGMPSAAIDTGCVERVLPLSAIAPALVELTEGAAA